MLNDIIVKVMTALAFPADEIEKAKTMVQRNQNQSAVGGCDLTNTFGMAIEVKRQETLAIPEWWRQVTKAAEKNNELHVQAEQPPMADSHLWILARARNERRVDKCSGSRGNRRSHLQAMVRSVGDW
jgi:hypothetical protein